MGCVVRIMLSELLCYLQMLLFPCLLSLFFYESISLFDSLLVVFSVPQFSLNRLLVFSSFLMMFCCDGCDVMCFAVMCYAVLLCAVVWYATFYSQCDSNRVSKASAGHTRRPS